MTDGRAEQGRRDDLTSTVVERGRKTDTEPARKRELRDIVRGIHDDLDLPEGYRAEIIGGDIVVSTRAPGFERDLPDVVRAIHDDLDLPEGYRAEIIEGDIVVAASPFARHAYIVWRIRNAVTSALAPDYGAFDNVTLEESGISRYIPDLAAWPVALMRDAVDEWIFGAEHCAFAVEVTSPRQESRDYAKANGYARGGVPVYLLVDRTECKCVVFREPTPDGYTTEHTVPFGEPVTLTFDLGDGGSRSTTIDTSDF